MLVVVLTGCGGHGASPDAAVDVPAEAFVPGEAGPCGTETLVSGAVVDLDSTTSQFQGVFDARFTLQGMPAKTTTTAPNGRFELCAPRSFSYVFDVEAPPGYLDGHAYLHEQALNGFYPLELRSFTEARAATFYAELGLVFDAKRAHVLLFVAGDRTDQILDRAHDAAHAAEPDDDGALAWSPGTTGRYVLFPNVDATSPIATLSIGVGPEHELPVAAGKLTLAATYFVFL